MSFGAIVWAKSMSPAWSALSSAAWSAYGLKITSVEVRNAILVPVVRILHDRDVVVSESMT